MTEPYTVFDWVYEDSRGRQRYARTPERADMLSRMGCTVVPVYVRGDIPLPFKRKPERPWFARWFLIGISIGGIAAILERVL